MSDKSFEDKEAKHIGEVNRKAFTVSKDFFPSLFLSLTDLFSIS